MNPRFQSAATIALLSNLTEEECWSFDPQPCADGVLVVSFFFSETVDTCVTRAKRLSSHARNLTIDRSDSLGPNLSRHKSYTALTTRHKLSVSFFEVVVVT